MRETVVTRAVPVVAHITRHTIHITRHTTRVIGIVVAVVCVVGAIAIYGLSTAGTARFVPVLSDSMAPTMPVGSLALTLPVPRADIKVGDVIVFIDPDHPTIRVIHRVLHIYGPDEAAKFTDWAPDKLIASTKGDNNDAVDPWTLVVSDATIWRLAGSVPYLGQPAIWFASPDVRMWAFSVAGIGIIGWMLILVWRRPSKKADPA